MSTTMMSLSTCALRNNIGALLLKKGDTEEGIQYLHSALEGPGCESKRAGLVWFLKKLERQSTVVETDEYYHNVVDHSHHQNDDDDDDLTGRSTSHHHHHHHHQYDAHHHHHRLATSHTYEQHHGAAPCCTRRGSIVEAVLTHEPVCNEDTPLGFEYFNEFVLVNSSNVNSSSKHIQQRQQDAVDHYVKVAIYLNLACVQYSSAVNTNDIEEVLKTLEKARGCCDSCTRCPLFQAIVHNNIAVCLCRLKSNRAREALQHIEQAHETLDDVFRIQQQQREEKRRKSTTEQWPSLSSSCGNLKEFEDENDDDDDHNDNDNDFVYLLEEDDEEENNTGQLYIQMTVLLNLSRICVRINQSQKATDHLKELANIAHERIPNSMYDINDCDSIINVTASLLSRMRWIATVGALFVQGMLCQRIQNFDEAITKYRDFLGKARHELGHDHIHVATVLYYKGLVLFEQRKLHHAMLAQLAALRIHESRISQNNKYEEEFARVMYAVARTLHDREEYRDALRMYTRALDYQKRLSGGIVSFDAVTTMCNLARIHHILGDLDASLVINYKIVVHAKQLCGGNDKSHPFVADRLVVLGNVLVEAGRTQEAMRAFAGAARMDGTPEQLRFSPASPYDVDGRAAVSLAKAGLQHPGAAMA